jgi:hypothetical protein
VAVRRVQGCSSVIANATRVHGCLASTFWEPRNTRQKRNGKVGSHGARVQNCSIFSSQASLSHPWFPIVSLNGHRQSGGHWNVALGLLGSSIGLPDWSADGCSCVGGRGALSRLGVRGVSDSLVVICKHHPKRRWRSGGAAPSKEQTTVGRVVPRTSFSSLEASYSPSIFRGWSLLHSV